MLEQVKLTLPDGAEHTCPQGVRGTELGTLWGRPLWGREDAAPVALAFNGQLQDLKAEIKHDGRVKPVFRDDPEALELLRHDCAHVLAQAVQELWPETKITFGPAIENGFYYDFYRETPFTPEDFPTIEERMKAIVDRDLPFERQVWTRDRAIQFFSDAGETFKAEHIQSLDQEEPISIYGQGAWLDLCRGPHLPSTGRLGKAFKLLSIAGAHWKGRLDGPKLQRIYGTCWRDAKELDQWLNFLEEAKKRDHRVLGRQLELFHTQQEAAGMIFWHPRGWTVYRALEDYMRRRQSQFGYQEVRTPQLYDRVFWEKSGHWDKFREDMLVVNEAGPESEMSSEMALKPMNCPGHVQIFRHRLRSYRELPFRLSEFGHVHRNEASGALSGLVRVRAFTQDDAHIFCTPDQLIGESRRVCQLIQSIYRDFGFDSVRVKFSDRPERRAGSDAVWDRAEKALAEAASILPLEHNPGEGAFYGPKLEFVLRDAIGRDWQCGTLQVDFVLPERLDASYIGENGQKQRPVMLHQANFGSLERFLGILLENFAGRLPLWLAPVQLVLCGITSAQDDYVRQACQEAQACGLRAEMDLRNEKINYKIRECVAAKIPYVLVAGARELETNQLTLRHLAAEAANQGRASKQTQCTMARADIWARLVEEAKPPAGVSSSGILSSPPTPTSRSCSL